MKTCIAILLGLGLATSGAFAQGTVLFANNNTTQIKLGATGLAYSNAPLAPTILTSVEFVWAELGTPVTPYSGGTLAAWLSSNPGWTAISSSIKALGPIAGRFNASAITANTSVPGATIQAYVIGWYTPGGAQPSFDAALNDGIAQVGFSDLFQIDTGNPLFHPVPDAPTQLVGSMSGFKGFLLGMPEPGVVSLAGLAGAMLFVFHRRR